MDRRRMIDSVFLTGTQITPPPTQKRTQSDQTLQDGEQLVTDSTENPMTEATNAMIAAAAGWLTPLDAPAVAQLRILAAQLDTEPTAALATSYGTAYRALIKRAPVAKPTDELGALLNGLG